jgi:DNA-directed RNA polymerase subunit H (RpoH/RPB5)
MPRHFVDTESPAPGLYTLAVYSHASFVNAFNVLTNEEKKEVKVLRSYWVGGSSDLPKIRESSDVSKLVSEYLVNSLAEKVRLYKANLNTGRLTPFKKTLDESVYRGGKEYREHLEEIKSKAKYDLEVIKALAEGKEPKLPDTDRAFMSNTPILTKEEIALILEKVAKNPEPTLPYRPASQTSQAQEIASAIKEALRPEKQTKTKTGE